MNHRNLHSGRRVKALLAVLFAAAALGTSTLCATASPQSEELRRQSEAELAAGRSASALEKAQAAVAADANDATAQLILGRAYMGAGQNDKALAAFDEATRLDPNLASRVAPLRAVIAMQTGDASTLQGGNVGVIPADNTQSLASLLTDARNRAGGAGGLGTGAPDTNTGLFGSGAVDDPFQVTVSIGAGYNDNALFLGDNIPLPLNSNRQSSAFLNFTLDAMYSWQRANGDGLSIGYGFDGDFYNDVSDADLMNHSVFANYRHAFNERLTGNFRLSDDYTLIDGDTYRNQIAFSPSLEYRHSERASTELGYNIAFNNYDFNGPNFQERDGKTHTFTLAHHLAPRNSRFQLRGGLFYQTNQADGSDYDFDGYGLFLGARHPLPWNITGDLSYVRSWDRYDNNNSLSTPAFSEKRRDNIDSIALQLTRPLSRKRDDLDVYFRYTYTRDDSNIPFFNYRQNVFSIGLIGRF